MQWKHFLKAATGAIVCASLLSIDVVYGQRNTTTDCENFGCPAVVDPVCGLDGVSYNNDCELRRAACKKPELKRAYKGSCGSPKPLCEQEDCPSVVDPVCTTTGVTYDNPCYLRLTNCRNNQTIQVAHKGKCPGTPAPVPTDPPMNDWCKRLTCDTFDNEPVCGTDGKTYGNPCKLQLVTCVNSSVQKAHDGACSATAPTDIPTSEPFECGRGNGCPAVFSPVCGTNGVTYGNSCELGQASCKDRGIRLAHKGKCASDSFTFNDI